MKIMNRAFASLLTAILLFNTGCARHIVSNPTEGYDSMGVIEDHVSTKAPVLAVLTLGIVRRHSYKCLVKKLNRKLEKTARGHYHADAVNNVQYWPAETSDAKIDVLYARGEMIRYKKFGASHSDPAGAL